jgi:hypothetical protein
VEHLSNKHRVLSSNPSTYHFPSTKKKKEKKKKEIKTDRQTERKKETKR